MDLKIVEQVQIDENGSDQARSRCGGRRSGRRRQGDLRTGGDCHGWRAQRAGRRPGHQHQNGVQMALDKHNAANPGCQIDLKRPSTPKATSEGHRDRPQIVDDATIIGLVGPAFSGETKATGGVFNQAGLVAATASATNVTSPSRAGRRSSGAWPMTGWGPSVANYMKTTLGDKKVCVVDDSTDYGTGLAQAVRNTLGPVSDASCSISVKKGDKDFSAAVTQVKGASPDSVFYSGYYAEAAPFVQQLRDAGFTGRFVSADGKGSGVRQAGRRVVQGCRALLPVRPRVEGLLRRVHQEFRPGSRHLQHRGLRPGSHHGQGHRLRCRHP